jgi:hypothetical protein
MVGEYVVSGLGADWFYGCVTDVWPGEGNKGEDWIRIETSNGLVICTDHVNVYGAVGNIYNG